MDVLRLAGVRVMGLLSFISFNCARVVLVIVRRVNSLLRKRDGGLIAFP